MTVVIPKIESTSETKEYVPPHHRCELKEGLSKFYAKKTEKRVILMKTKKPMER